MLNKVLFHGRNCMDGKMAAFVMSLYLPSNLTQYVEVSYGEDMPDVSGKHVYIVDFSYPPEVLKEASKTALSITMLDHHLTASQQWGGYFTSTDVEEFVCPNYISVEEDMSGAGMAYEYVLNLDPSLYNRRMSEIVNAVQDRDLWRFKLPGTKVIFEMLNNLEGNFCDILYEVVFDYTEEQYQDLLTEAKVGVDLRERLAVEYSANYTMITYEGHSVPIVNVPVNFCSRVGEMLAQEHPFAILYSLKGNTAYCSLRSNITNGIDVSEIAKRRDGGGHMHAAGFRVTANELVDIINSTN